MSGTYSIRLYNPWYEDLITLSVPIYNNIPETFSFEDWKYASTKNQNESILWLADPTFLHLARVVDTVDHVYSVNYSRAFLLYWTLNFYYVPVIRICSSFFVMCSFLSFWISGVILSDVNQEEY